MKSKILSLLLVLSVITLSYYTYRAYRFIKASEHYFEYLNSGMHCLIQEQGETEMDIKILYNGHYRNRKAYIKAENKKHPGTFSLDEPFTKEKTAYDDQIPQCKEFYSQYLCWELDPHDIKSLEGCGPHFGYTKEDIEKVRKDPSKADQVSDEVWERQKKEK